jgi:hypothetical protein
MTRQPVLKLHRDLRTRRANAGQSLSELAAALVVMTPILLAAIDGGTILMGAALNDSTCRDAARAAASGPPGDQSIGTRAVASDKAPYKRAVAVIQNVYNTNLPMKIRDTLQISETVKDYPPANSGGGSLDGEVSVQTVIDVYPPFLIHLLVGEDGISLKTKHIVPYTYTISATTSG